MKRKPKRRKETIREKHTDDFTTPEEFARFINEFYSNEFAIELILEIIDYKNPMEFIDFDLENSEYRRSEFSEIRNIFTEVDPNYEISFKFFHKVRASKVVYELSTKPLEYEHDVVYSSGSFGLHMWGAYMFDVDDFDAPVEKTTFDLNILDLYIDLDYEINEPGLEKLYSWIKTLRLEGLHINGPYDDTENKYDDFNRKMNLLFHTNNYLTNSVMLLKKLIIGNEADLAVSVHDIREYIDITHYRHLEIIRVYCVPVKLNLYERFKNNSSGPRIEELVLRFWDVGIDPRGMIDKINKIMHRIKDLREKKIKEADVFKISEAERDLKNAIFELEKNIKFYVYGIKNDGKIRIYESTFENHHHRLIEYLYKTYTPKDLIVWNFNNHKDIYKKGRYNVITNPLSLPRGWNLSVTHNYDAYTKMLEVYRLTGFKKFKVKNIRYVCPTFTIDQDPYDITQDQNEYFEMENTKIADINIINITGNVYKFICRNMNNRKLVKYEIDDMGKTTREKLLKIILNEARLREVKTERDLLIEEKSFIDYDKDLRDTLEPYNNCFIILAGENQDFRYINKDYQKIAMGFKEKWKNNPMLHLVPETGNMINITGALCVSIYYNLPGSTLSYDGLDDITDHNLPELEPRKNQITRPNFNDIMRKTKQTINLLNRKSKKFIVNTLRVREKIPCCKRMTRINDDGTVGDQLDLADTMNSRDARTIKNYVYKAHLPNGVVNDIYNVSEYDNPQKIIEVKHTKNLIIYGDILKIPSVIINDKTGGLMFTEINGFKEVKVNYGMLYPTGKSMTSRLDVNIGNVFNYVNQEYRSCLDNEGLNYMYMNKLYERCMDLRSLHDKISNRLNITTYKQFIHSRRDNPIPLVDGAFAGIIQQVEDLLGHFYNNFRELQSEVIVNSVFSTNIFFELIPFYRYVHDDTQKKSLFHQKHRHFYNEYVDYYEKRMDHILDIIIHNILRFKIGNGDNIKSPKRPDSIECISIDSPVFFIINKSNQRVDLNINMIEQSIYSIKKDTNRDIFFRVANSDDMKISVNYGSHEGVKLSGYLQKIFTDRSIKSPETYVENFGTFVVQVSDNPRPIQVKKHQVIYTYTLLLSEEVHTVRVQPLTRVYKIIHVKSLKTQPLKEILIDKPLEPYPVSHMVHVEDTLSFYTSNRALVRSLISSIMGIDVLTVYINNFLEFSKKDDINSLRLLKKLDDKTTFNIKLRNVKNTNIEFEPGMSLYPDNISHYVDTTSIPYRENTFKSMLNVQDIMEVMFESKISNKDTFKRYFKYSYENSKFTFDKTSEDEENVEERLAIRLLSKFKVVNILGHASIKIHISDLDVLQLSLKNLKLELMNKLLFQIECNTLKKLKLIGVPPYTQINIIKKLNDSKPLHVTILESERVSIYTNTRVEVYAPSLKETVIEIVNNTKRRMGFRNRVYNTKERPGNWMTAIERVNTAKKYTVVAESSYIEPPWVFRYILNKRPIEYYHVYEKNLKDTIFFGDESEEFDKYYDYDDDGDDDDGDGDGDDIDDDDDDDDDNIDDDDDDDNIDDDDDDDDDNIDDDDDDDIIMSDDDDDD